MAKEVQNSREAHHRFINNCKYMGISPLGTDAYLTIYASEKTARDQEEMIKMIQADGVGLELRQACRDRRLAWNCFPVEEMRQQLHDWLELSLNRSVQSSLLILSRAFSISGKVRPEDDVPSYTLGIISSLTVRGCGYCWGLQPSAIGRFSFEKGEESWST
ncbi:hypothetical protein NC651_019071 [Populus alba x Populus x berolinensis]|nr:hypothetical protein NC651_019071 [Populus alba x Populus x berolinensis]